MKSPVELFQGVGWRVAFKITKETIYQLSISVEKFTIHLNKNINKFLFHIRPNNYFRWIKDTIGFRSTRKDGTIYFIVWSEKISSQINQGHTDHRRKD